ncbi:hypothetical protein EVG20_g9796 [Dentipellis fragilis]|uniref:F-box domain-containing protein n=1 Tax=Dentipellis fragilis TaxID=205917 RepID=A0A4Y9XVD3_9AGAM|nr:hypothetical protein EVG20_g9796 [Dentipellis fragilis]
MCSTRDTRVALQQYIASSIIPHPTIMRQIPLELARAIIDEVTASKDLRALRATCKWWHAEATPYAFRTMIVGDTARSAMGLANVLQNAALAPHVREILYQDPMADNEGGWVQHAMDIERDIPEDVFDALTAAFALAANAHSLSFVKLIFYPDYVEESWDDDSGPSAQLRVQRAILGGFACAASAGLRLHTLVLLNLIAVHSPVFDEPTFATLLAPLHVLRIDIISGYTEGNFPLDKFSEFWETSMTDRLLPPAGPEAPLEVLTIQSQEDVGLQPWFSLGDRMYPRLAELSVTHIMFDGLDGGVEEFIVRHAGTLRRLDIKNGKIGIEQGEEGPTQFWAAIWTRFRETLTELQELVVGEKEGMASERGLIMGILIRGGGILRSMRGRREMRGMSLRCRRLWMWSRRGGQRKP